MSRPTLYWAKVVTLDGLMGVGLRFAPVVPEQWSTGPFGTLNPTRRFTHDQTGPCPGPTRLSTWTRAGTIPAPRQRLCPCILAESSSCTTLYFITFPFTHRNLPHLRQSLLRSFLFLFRIGSVTNKCLLRSRLFIFLAIKKATNHYCAR